MWCRKKFFKYWRVLVPALLLAGLCRPGPGPAAETGGGGSVTVPEEPPLVALTFDDGPRTSTTSRLLDGLALREIQATFFLVGDWVDKYPESVQALHEAGMEVMNHSNHHDHYNALSADQIIADVTACNDKVKAITGVAPTLIRCPYGEYDDHVISAIRSMGMEPIQWDVEPPAAE